MTKPTTNYDVPQSRIFDEARHATDGIIVLAVKNGKPVMWADGDEAKAQGLLSQFFPSAVLPERELERQQG